MIRPSAARQVALRPFRDADREHVLAGRDREWERWLGPGSPEPSPTYCIVVADAVVGWIDADASPGWLRPGEVNVGYSVFREHRGNGYAATAVDLLVRAMSDRGDVRTALFVIDPDNAASLRVVGRAGARRLAGREIPAHPRSVVHALDVQPASGCPPEHPRSRC